ncbi:IPT/TIG domain-containing protein [Tunturibacter empetritectus]|uniref:IPT/TIG domain-containing protein n=1 Tax=Tunturiibacter empetritectus TaxID=3069691 RepID=A0AAU7ZGY4_9BACT
MKPCLSFAFVSAIVCLSVALFVSGCGSSSPAASGGGTTQTPPPAALVITSIRPTSVPAGSTAVTVTVAGSGFLSTSVVHVNGTSSPTTYVSPTELATTVPAAYLATGAMLQITVSNGSTSTGSDTSAIALEVDNPAPIITGYSPSGFLSGAMPVTVAVTGSDFVPATVIQVNGTARETTYIDATHVSVLLTANDLANPGNIVLVAINPAPGGGTSAGASLPVTNPVPGVISVAPSTVAVGSATATTISVTGTSFIPGSVVHVNGSSRPTTVGSPTQLSFQLTVADQAAAGSLQVNVVNPSPGGGASSGISLLVSNPTPSVVSLTPNTVAAGAATPTPVTVVGSSFIPGSAVQVNGSSRATTIVSATQLSFQLTVADQAAAGSLQVDVVNPAPGGGASASVPFVITSPSGTPPPVLASISPPVVPINQDATVLINGDNFTSTSTVVVNGVTVPFTCACPQQLSLSIPASALSVPGISTITVTNDSGTSSPIDLTTYVPIINNSMIYNPANGLFYLSVPSYAPAPYSNSIVSVDPVTGALGTPIPVGSEPNRLAISSDGQNLWVALDGASAVRQVNLATGTAGLQFPIPADTLFEGPGLVASMAAIPGQPNSVAVMSYFPSDGPNGILLAIYDSGVPRPTTVSYVAYDPFPWAMVVNAATNEIYGPGDPLGIGGYSTYTYNSSGITREFSTSSGENTAESNVDDVQLANGVLYTSYGQAINPANADVLGTFYPSGTTAAMGSIAVDTTLGKAFFLENITTNFFIGTGFSAYQIGAFNLSNYTATSDTPIQIAAPESRVNYQYEGPTGPRLTRWGSNGLAFHGTGGFISFRSNLVQNLSTTNADLAVALTPSGATATGNTTTYTAIVTNNGPSSASNVDLTAFLPSTGILVSSTSSSGTCAGPGPISCDLGGLSSNGTAIVTIVVQQLSSGSATMTVQVSASENDPAPANNQASSTQTITGGDFSALPTLTSISPQVIASGSTATNLTVTGTGFNSSSTVLLNGSSLSTTFNNSTTLTAVVLPADVASLGWASISVATPAPGGGTSAVLPLTVFSVLKLGANHILYDPYSRNLMASIGAGTASVAANSILAITPDTASIGIPVPIGGVPTDLALTYDGQILYTLLPATANGSIARFNMLTQQPDFTVSGFQSASYDTPISYVSTMPGTEDTVAIYIGEYTGAAVIDFNTAQHTAAERGSPTGIYSGMCPVFLSSTVLVAPVSPDAGEGATSFPVTASGISRGTNIPVSTACFKLIAGIAYGETGAVVNFNSATPIYNGIFHGAIPLVVGTSGFGMEADPSLNVAFYPTLASSNGALGAFDSISTFNTTTFATTSVLSLPFASIEGSTTSFSPVDTFRWGQDGLAILTSTGNVYLLRGPAIVPQLLDTNTPVTLSSSSLTSVTHGTGNTVLTLTGTNFVPGVAVLWNGSYRTTTIVDPAHVSVAIPASDLASAGTATITAANPGAAVSAPLYFNIN